MKKIIIAEYRAFKNIVFACINQHTYFFNFYAQYLFGKHLDLFQHIFHKLVHFIESKVASA
jgi:hypothetical protein